MDLLTDCVDDYNSWQESFWGRWKRKRLPKNTILAEGWLLLSTNARSSYLIGILGYKEFNMHRRTLNWMGNRLKNKDKEVHLDGIGGVNILVKADVHRSGNMSL